MIVYTNKHHLPFLIDERDYEVVSWFSWCLHHNYPVTRSNKQFIRIHNLLFGRAPEGLEWDHINQDRTDNRRENLRLVTHRMNCRNKPIQARNISGMRGVTWASHRDCWLVHVTDRDGRQFHVGHFKSLEEAKLARQLVERKLWPENTPTL